MNLYKETFIHFSPKDSEFGMRGYFLAENDRRAYDVVYPSDCQTVDQLEYDEGEFCIEDECYNPGDISVEEARQIVADKRGEINMEIELHDLYYGLSFSGWELVQENILPQEIKTLTRLGILKENKE